MESNQNEDVMIIDSENKIGLNEWNMKDQIMNGSVQIEQNIIKIITNPNENNEMEKEFQTSHTQRKKWRGHNKNAICWAFYYVNGYKEVDPTNFQVRRCVFCYNLVYAFNPNIKKRIGLITYFNIWYNNFKETCGL